MTRRPGYTLLEVLLALGIFVIGFTAAAALFPVAALLQKRTLDDVESRIVVTNAENILRGRGVSYDAGAPVGDLDPYYTPGADYTDITPFAEGGTGTDLAGLLDDWTLLDRGYPTTVSAASDRDYVWFPLVRDADPDTDNTNPDWTFYLFVLQVDGGSSVTYTASTYEPSATSYPSVESVSGVTVNSSKTRFEFTNDDGSGNFLVDASDWVLDNNGVIYKTTQADGGGVTVGGRVLTTPKAPTTLYYGTRPTAAESESSVVRILAIKGDEIVSAP